MFVVCTCASSVIIHHFPQQPWFASTVAALSQIFVGSKQPVEPSVGLATMKALVSKALRLTTLSIISKMRGETTTTLCFPLFHTLKPHVLEHPMSSSGHLFQ